jgi:hypothetical protein
MNKQVLGFVYKTDNGGTVQIKAFDRETADSVMSACYDSFTFSHINRSPL